MQLTFRNLPVQGRTLALAGVTVLTALTIGYRMQYGADAAAPVADLAPSDLSDIATTSSLGAMVPRADLSAAVQQALPRPVQGESATGAVAPEEPAQTAAAGDDCAVTMSAEASAGAMIDLTIDAPCNGGDRVTLYHHGLVVTELMDADGTLATRLPALSETAVVMAELASGGGGTATAAVTSLPFYDRAVVQWTGEAGLQLHAREFGADYFSDGHVWAGAAGDVGDAAQGAGGFLMRLGRADLPEARLAEVYSFPTGTAQRGGAVALTVEAEVTQANCGRAIEAQTIQHAEATGLTARDLDLRIPGCDSVGDFLVLKNLVQDLNIAAR